VFNDQLLAIWRGIDGDQGLWYSVSRDGINWDDQQGIPGKASNTGVGLSVFNGQLIMAWRGIGDDQSWPN